ncbi:helix-turn-helix domain-containing protein [Paenibacillus prosopidis]|uniref:Two-component system response regulator YesN n=1 Tax=Paenibacillus prosopidis TaxID=630520 RepID=A0A368VL68_9BACL|nr:helix-turn-helix domain-containing protein [Paenibacillus prosopidis]RCW42234.1 two-component system response regulator YesN [Paenibacillus prosopidis]
MKVILVDDERIALEHVKSLLPWDEHGYEIAATATNGRSALRLCEEIRPQIMIVDIRMPVMDGLELIRAVSGRKLGVKFIVMSAYEDFEYARQAISIGNVSSYLIKHEVDRNKLLHELNKAKEAWETDEKQRRVQRSEQLMDLLTGTELTSVFLESGAKPPFAMLLIQGDSPFSDIPSVSGRTETIQSLKWASSEIHLYADQSSWQLIGEFPLNRNQFIALFSQKNKSAALMRESFRELTLTIHSHIKRQYGRSCSLYFAFQSHDSSSLPNSLRLVEAAARHAVFCGKNMMLCADELPLLTPDKAGSMATRSIRLEKLIEAMNQKDAGTIESAIKDQFHSLCYPQWDLPGLYETVHALTGLINKRLAAKGLPEINPLDEDAGEPIYHIDQIMNRFILIIQRLCANNDEQDQISGKMLRALRYIQEHYHKDINIEDVSRSTGISASYLHQLFKRELARTFLDYLTEHRINQAKLILSQEDAKMTEVCARVGYRSPQHFSQVFKKTTGILPHQYRHGGYSS